MGDIIRALGEFITSASAGERAFAAFCIIVIGYIIIRLFSKDHVWVRLAVFMVLVSAIGLFAYRTVADSKPDEVNKAPMSEEEAIGTLLDDPADARKDPPRAVPKKMEGPPPKTCNPGPYIAYFKPSDAKITAAAASTLDMAVQAYRGCGKSKILLTAIDNGEGTEEVAERRLQRLQGMVKSYFQNGGIDPKVIQTETQLGDRVEGVPGIRSTLNSRIEVTFGPA